MTRRLYLLLAFGAMCAVFYLYTYNSGYGWDALEYMIIGRSLLDGYGVFDFSPSKSPGIFYVVAGFLRAWPDAGPGAFSLLITLIFAAIVAGTYRVIGRTHGPTAATIGAAVVAASCFFMEMNFLETEAFVFLLALPALPALRNGMRTGRLLHFALAGWWIGCACFFKIVAIFYIAGAAIFIAAWNLLKARAPFSDTVKHVATLGIGVLLCSPLVAYAFAGQAKEYLHWTYAFPLLHYPADTIFLSKLYTKLAWFFLLLLLCGVLALNRRIRAVLQMSCYPGIALAMGLTALYALTKNQASHYVFPAAGFLSIFMGIVLGAAMSANPAMKRVGVAMLCVAAVAVPVSAALYRPAAIKRFLHVRDYSEDARAGERIRSFVRKDQHALFFGHMKLYWSARRYPNIPYIAHHVQFTDALRSDPDMLTRALEDRSLVLVEYDPQAPGIRDPRFFEDANLVQALRAFEDNLRRSFRPVDLGIPGYRFWLRANH